MRYIVLYPAGYVSHKISFPGVLSIIEPEAPGVLLRSRKTVDSSFGAVDVVDLEKCCNMEL